MPIGNGTAEFLCETVKGFGECAGMVIQAIPGKILVSSDMGESCFVDVDGASQTVLSQRILLYRLLMVPADFGRVPSSAG